MEIGAIIPENVHCWTGAKIGPLGFFREGSPAADPKKPKYF
jgi:hypothetical protein